MSDIIERLRQWNDGVWLDEGPNLLHEAADEIEQLRAELARLRTELELAGAHDGPISR